MILTIAAMCANMAILPESVAPGRDMYVWESRTQLECFCERRPAFRDCHNLRNPAWQPDYLPKDQQRVPAPFPLQRRNKQ
jgi:hypothetical protein